MPVTNKNDFELFQKFCMHWVEVFGLTEWELKFKHEEFKESAWAYMTFNDLGQLATFHFNRNLDVGDVIEDWEQVALHEVLEMLLHDLDRMAQARTWNEEEFEAERHKVINRILKALLETRETE